MSTRTFMERLKLACQTDNVAEIARVTGIPYNTLKNYNVKGGSRLPNGDVLAQIAEATNINLNWLLTGEGDMFIRQKDDDAKPEKGDRRSVEFRIPAFSVFISIPVGELDLKKS